MGTLDFELHDILIFDMKNGKRKGGKYLEKEKEENIWGKENVFLMEKKNG